jgi:L-lactate dehydrogenase
MPQSGRKIAIIGAGGVGATIAYACMIRGVGKQIVLHDVNAKKVGAEVLDLNHGLQFVPMATIEGSADVEICRDADVIVMTAGAKQKPGQTRMDLAQANVAICRQIVPPLLRVAPEAILLLVTNPVDVITYVTLKLSGLPRERVFGSGTVLDSSRLRFLIARHLDVAVQNVHAYIAGEHGDSEIPLWSSADVANAPLRDWNINGRSLSDKDRAAIFDDVKNAAYQIIQGKGATNYAIGLATAKILEAVLNNEQRILPVSSLLDRYRGISDVCLSVPTIVNASGVGATIDIPLDGTELAGLRKSADTIRGAIRSMGF